MTSERTLGGGRALALAQATLRGGWARRLGRRMGGVAALVATLIGAGCAGSGSGAAVAVPTPERGSTVLLAPSVDAETSSDDTTAEPTGAAIDRAAAPTPEPRAVPTMSLSCLSQRQRYAQLMLALATQAELDAGVSQAAAGDLGGIVLLGEPDASIEGQLHDLQQASFVPLMIASDEEGGTVQRLTGPLGALPSAATLAETRTPDEVRTLFHDYGERARALGIDVILAPVIDVGAGPGIGSRSFGTDPAVVAIYGAAVAHGLADAGVMAVFKHFPGHGRGTVDSHVGLPTTPSLDEMRATDLVPFVELLGDDAAGAGVMVGHLLVPGLTDELPTSLSAETINGLLKTEIGFDGLVFTDALNMGAIVERWGSLEAIEQSLRAGVDIAIIGSLAEVGPALDHLEAVAAADPGFAALLDARVRRVLTAKGQQAICAGA